MLGEFFRCRYDYPDGTQGFYIAEQGDHSKSVADEKLIANGYVQYLIIRQSQHSFTLRRNTVLVLLGNFAQRQNSLAIQYLQTWKERIEFVCWVPHKMEVCKTAQPFPILTVLTEYVVTMPNMYARGILFGKMVLELGDTCAARNEKHGLSCDLDFKTKVFERQLNSEYLLKRNAGFLFRIIQCSRWKSQER